MAKSKGLKVVAEPSGDVSSCRQRAASIIAARRNAFFLCILMAQKLLAAVPTSQDSCNKAMATLAALP